MKNDFKSSAVVEHRGSKGTVRERQLRDSFLKKYIPKTGTVFGSGELLSSSGERSNQCDIMIVDPETPPLWAAEDSTLVPVECCYAVIEVKSQLTVQQLKKCWTDAKKVKSLPRGAYLKDGLRRFSGQRSVHGREWQNAMPIFYFVFAYKGASMDTLAKEMSSLAREDAEPWIGIDALIVLDSGVVTWHNKETEKMFERLAESACVGMEMSAGQELMFMQLRISEILSNARHNDGFDVRNYLNTEVVGKISTYRNGKPHVNVPGYGYVEIDSSSG